MCVCVCVCVYTKGKSVLIFANYLNTVNTIKKCSTFIIILIIEENNK